MNIDIESLPDDPAALKALLSKVVARNHYLEEQFRLAQHKQFGQRSEGHPGQGELFNEAEALIVETDEQELENISYTRNKPTRKPLPKDLPREVVVHDIADVEKVCDCCGSDLHKIGEDKSEKLEFIPAQVKVIEHVKKRERVTRLNKRPPLTVFYLKGMLHQAC